jgi:hypothetical protein
MKWSKTPKPHGGGEVQVMNMVCLSGQQVLKASYRTKVLSLWQASHEKKERPSDGGTSKRKKKEVNCTQGTENFTIR